MVCDLAEASATQQCLSEIKPDAVIHAQALSDVDQCERDPAQADVMNRQTVAHLCCALELQRESRPWLIAVSTDYVFDGTKGRPYHEEDLPHPVSVYGRSKFAGERAVLDYGRGVVVRLSTLFGPGHANFCDTIVQRFRRGESVEAFADQTTSPTYTADVAGALPQLLRALASRDQARTPRMYHLTNAGACTRVEFATHVAGLMGYDGSLIRVIAMNDQRRPAPRPAYSALTSRYLRDMLGRTLRPWQEAVSEYLASQGWRN